MWGPAGGGKSGDALGGLTSALPQSTHSPPWWPLTFGLRVCTMFALTTGTTLSISGWMLSCAAGCRCQRQMCSVLKHRSYRQRGTNCLMKEDQTYTRGASWRNLWVKPTANQHCSHLADPRFPQVSRVGLPCEGGYSCTHLHPGVTPARLPTHQTA